MSTKAQPLSVVGKALQEGENCLNQRDRNDALAIMTAEACGDTKEVLKLARQIVERNVGLEIVGRAQVRDDMDGAQDAMADLMAKERKEAGGKTTG